MSTDLPYPYTDNFWCREFYKVMKCQYLPQMVIFTAVHCCGCLPSQTCRTCQCTTQLVSLESTEWLQESSPSANCGFAGMQKETQRGSGGHQSATRMTSIMTHGHIKVQPQESQRSGKWPHYSKEDPLAWIPATTVTISRCTEEKKRRTNTNGVFPITLSLSHYILLREIHKFVMVSL